MNHRSLQGVAVFERGFQDPGYVPSVHGTAVASLLVAEEDAPAPRLLVADVYGGAPTGGAADSVAAAFSWLAEEQAPVINVSLVGPENALLDVVISRVAERGALIVAAVGNDGPAAAPLYPAAHPDVIAVTGVDRRNRALIEAGRGAHVMFAARGEDVRVAELGGGTAEVRGTSFAAPVVARQLAMVHRAPNPETARAAVQMLIDTVRDLRPRGRDETYGYGLVDDDSAGVLTASVPDGAAN
jgi:subtilisin family serine protease